MNAAVEPRPGRRPGVSNFIRTTSLRLSQEESDLVNDLGSAMNVSNAEVFRFFVRKYGPAYLDSLENGDGEQKQYQEFRDPIQTFWNRFREQFVWDLLPYSYLYELYGAWLRAEKQDRVVVSAMKFTQTVRGLTEHDALWSPGAEAGTKHRPASKMSAGEPLSVEYGLERWLNPEYTGPDRSKQGIPGDLRLMYRGLVRK